MGFLQVIMLKGSNQLFTGCIDSSAAVSDGEPAPMTVAILLNLSIHLLPPDSRSFMRMATIYGLPFCLMDSIPSCPACSLAAAQRIH